MSVKVWTAVLGQSQATGGTLLVALVLADYANESGVCWPGIRKLAERARLSERQVQRALRQLEKLGEIAIEINAAEWGTNLYSFRIGEWG